MIKFFQFRNVEHVFLICDDELFTHHSTVPTFTLLHTIHAITINHIVVTIKVNESR